MIAIGLFYAFAGVVAGRAAMTDAVLDHSLAALSARKRDPRDVERTAWLLVGAALVGLAGLLLCVRSQLAAPAFVIASAWQLLFLTVLGPARFDRVDPPDPAGRRASWNAFWIHAAATALTIALALNGRLNPPTGAPAADWPTWAAFALTAGALVWSGLWIARVGRGGGAATSEDAFAPVEDDPLDPFPPARGHEDPDFHVVVNACFGRPCLTDGRHGGVIREDQAVDFLPKDVVDRALAFERRFDRLADPDAPGRDALLDPADLPGLLQEGDALAAAIAETLPGRVRHEPRFNLFPERERFKALRVAASVDCWPVWHDAPDDAEAAVGSIWPDALPVSWRLAKDIERWAVRLDEAIDPDDPGGPLRWPPGGDVEHDRAGLALARRLHDELRRQAIAAPVRFVALNGAVTRLDDDASVG
jgi:hypothetical protein